MKLERTFLLAPALVRLLQRERMISRDIIEGYLSRTPERLYFVRLEPDNCNLLLVINAEGGSTEDRAKVSSAQAQAFLDACPGRITYRRNLVRIGPGLDVYLDCFDGLHLLSVQFDDAATAYDFVVPVWFGPEVTDNPGYQKASFALDGVPDTEEVPVSNATIIAFLDCLQPTGTVGSVAALTPKDALAKNAGELAEVRVGQRGAAEFAASEERMSNVLVGLSDALSSSGEKKRTPFLVPVPQERVRV